MRRSRILTKFMCVAVLASVLCTSLASVSCITSDVFWGAKKAQAAKKVTWPGGPSKSSLSSDSAIVMELSTGSILYRKNIHKQQYPASITKILTAMLTAENCSLSETVKFSEKAVYGIEAGSSTIYTDVNEKLTVEQCLYAIMLESANEVCLGVGEHISGSSSKFVDLMNQRVKELGLKNTHFNNPNGLPDTKHYTTAYDMAVISRQAMQNSTFRKVAATKSYVMPKTNKHKEKRYWNNHHQMINGYKYPQYEYKYCIGGKTGYTNAARNTLVTFAEKDGMELVCVVMRANGPRQGTPNEYTDTIKLLNFAFEKYNKYTVGEKTSTINQDLFNNYDSYFDAEKSPIHLASESAVVLPKGVKLSEATQTVSYNQNVALKTGENVIGHVTYTYGGKTVGSTDILYTVTEDGDKVQLDSASRKIVGSEIKELEESKKKDEKKANFWKKVKNSVVGFFGYRVVQILSVILLIAAAVFIILCAMKHIELPRMGRKRRNRMSGGYRSKRAQRLHASKMRRMRRNERKANRKVRRNFSKHYEKHSPRAEKQKKSKGVRYHKNHKRTKESFGKNFFDF